MIQILFEFPRQQSSEGNGTPEVAQFKASQKLLAPNNKKGGGTKLYNQYMEIYRKLQNNVVDKTKVEKDGITDYSKYKSDNNKIIGRIEEMEALIAERTRKGSITNFLKKVIDGYPVSANYVEDRKSGSAGMPRPI
uniref:Uncharacterized protein n=1 Tax=Panagrolaimus sp. PS1159 TaxID=55785 RepID=A0AC35GHR1_9BILA